MQRIPLVTARNKVANFCLFKEFLLDVTCSCSGLIIPALCRKKKEQWKRHSHSARQTIDVALVWANGLPELLWSSDGFPETMIYVRFAESLHSLPSFQGCLKCNLNGPGGLHPAGRIHSTEPSCGFSTANLMSFRYLCLQQCCSAFVEGPHTNDEVGCDILPTSL
ncbi:uncharacterized protein LOC121111175 isoform X2 [Gallus gallus]|uniref:uncharacterized protein LOC121111175 isoform X2 n=1 Tax=Gallus gallus TaxID=9031 RepID=UPI001AE33049|nr:uncharacterized protein LOC121111175 isoform X2 [Gallus gallus]